MRIKRLSCKRGWLCAALLLQISHGETFLSETDTEVIPKLCKYVYNNLTERVSLSMVSYP